MKIAEIWKKSNIAEKISIIMVILNALFISVTGLLHFFFNIVLFFHHSTIQDFAVSWLLIFLGIYSWRNNRVFAYLLWFAAISVFITTCSNMPVFYNYYF